jgi:hypothetical protein
MGCSPPIGLGSDFFSFFSHPLLEITCMPNFIIKTHQKNAIYRTNQVFILNKGMNSGNWSEAKFNNTKKQ